MNEAIPCVSSPSKITLSLNDCLFVRNDLIDEKKINRYPNWVINIKAIKRTSSILGVREKRETDITSVNTKSVTR